MFHRLLWMWGIVLGLALLGSPDACRADADGAKKYLEEATQKAQSGDLKDAETSLQLAEAELDGVDAAAAAPIKAQIEQLKKALASAGDAEAKDRLVRDVENQIKQLKDTLGIPGWEDDAKRLEEQLADPANKSLLGDAEIAKYAKQVGTFRKVNSSKSLERNLETLKREFDSFEKSYPDSLKTIKDAESSPGSKDGAIQDIQRGLERLERARAEIPADEPRMKPFADKIAGWGKEFTEVALADQAKEISERLTAYWETNRPDFEGWEKETGGLTFDQYMKVSSEATGRFNYPKTVELIQKTDQFMDARKDDESYKQVAAAPAVKALIDRLAKDRATAYAKVLKAATQIVDEAEKATLDENVASALGKLSGGGARGDLHIALGDESPDLKPLIDRCEALIKKREQATTGAETARADAYAKLKEAATRVWPDLASGFSAENSFDPNNAGAMRGKLIRLTTNNRMGWDFGPGDFPFATTINGVAIAGKYDPEVAAGVAEVQQKIGRSLGDSDDDGDWEIIARVEGSTGKLSKRVTREGTIKDNAGNSADVRAEGHESVDAPIITIVAMRCGPLAVASGKGVVKEDGKVEKANPNSGGSSGSSTGGSPKSDLASNPGNSSPGGSKAGAPAAPAALASTSTVGSGISAWFWRLFTLAVGMVAAASCLMLANYAPLASASAGQRVQQQLGGQNLALIGLACAAIGLLLLLRGYVVYGLLTNLAIVSAGLLAATEWLVGTGLVSEAHARAVKPARVPVGLACAALVIMSLLLWLMGVNLAVV